MIALGIPREKEVGQPIPNPELVGDEPPHQGVIKKIGSLVGTQPQTLFFR